MRRLLICTLVRISLMGDITVVFTAKETLRQIHRELIKAGADLENISIAEWKCYILARAIEDVFLIDLTPSIIPCMENMSLIIRSNYRRHDGEDLVTLHQDVGTYKLYQFLTSNDLPFESQLELQGNRVTIRRRSAAR